MWYILFRKSPKGFNLLIRMVQGVKQKERGIVDEAVNKANAANRAWQAKVEKSGIGSLKGAGIKQGLQGRLASQLCGSAWLCLLPLP